MAKNEIHLNDIGTKFLVTIKDADSVVDISGTGATAANKRIIFKKPSGTMVDQDGIWKMQAKVIITGQIFHSDIHTFKVHRNL